jgi:hypothetical protein
MFFLLDQKEPKNQENPIRLRKGNTPPRIFFLPAQEKCP